MNTGTCSIIAQFRQNCGAQYDTACIGLEEARQIIEFNSGDGASVVVDRRYRIREIVLTEHAHQCACYFYAAFAGRFNRRQD